MASIEFTPSGGVPLVLTMSWPDDARASRRFHWHPDYNPVGDVEFLPATGVVERWNDREDYLASVRLPGIVRSQHATAIKLKRHLMDGGSVTLRTDDAADRVYTVILAPGSVPEITGPDEGWEYEFAAQFKNTAAAEMVVSYEPAALILRAGDELAAFTRATAASYRDSLGKVATVASGIPRAAHYPVSGVRSLLIEAANQNAALRSEEMGNGAVWAPTGLASITDNDGTWRAPDGTQTLDRLIEDTSTGLHSIAQNITITAAETCAASVWFRAGSRTRGALRWGDGGANFILADINTATGAIITATGGAATLSRAYVESWPNGHYRVVIVGAINAGVTAGVLTLQLLDASGNGSYTGNSSYGFFWGAQLERSQPVASSYIKTTDSVVTRNSDQAKVTMPFGPQAMWVYHRFRELGTVISSGQRAWQLGTTGGAHLIVHRGTSGTYAFRHGNGAINTEVESAVTPALFAEVEQLAVLDSNGRPDFYQCLNRGAVESILGGGTPIGFAAAWSTMDLWIGTAPASDTGYAAHERLIVGRGTMTLVGARGIAG